MIDITNNRYGKLTVVKLQEVKRYSSNNNNQTKSYWLCKCDCGNEKIVRGEHLRYRKTTSCGCIAKKKASERMKKLTRINRTHGLSRTLTYRSYASMTARILNQDAHHRKYYGGISICNRWIGENGLDNFTQDMGERPSLEYSIDRINPSGNYEPENCRWSNHTEQMRNQKRNHGNYDEYLSLNPVVPYQMFRQRVDIQKWDKMKSATTPKMKNQFI